MSATYPATAFDEVMAYRVIEAITTAVPIGEIDRDGKEWLRIIPTRDEYRLTVHRSDGWVLAHLDGDVLRLERCGEVAGTGVPAGSIRIEGIGEWITDRITRVMAAGRTGWNVLVDHTRLVGQTADSGSIGSAADASRAVETIRSTWRIDAEVLRQLGDDLAGNDDFGIAAAEGGIRQATAALKQAMEWLDDVVELLNHTKGTHDDHDGGGPADC